MPELPTACNIQEPTQKSGQMMGIAPTLPGREPCRGLGSLALFIEVEPWDTTFVYRTLAPLYGGRSKSLAERGRSSGTTYFYSYTKPPVEATLLKMTSVTVEPISE